MIKVREHEFVSHEECAAFFGVQVKHVKALEKKGRLEVLGIGSSGKGYPKHRVGTMKVRVRGVVYANAHECAAALGVAPDTVYSAVCRGTEDTLGLGPTGPKRYGGGRSKPIKIGPHVFPSIAAASRALGRNSKWVSEVLRKKGKRAMQHLYAAMLAYKPPVPQTGDYKHDNQPLLGEAE